MTSAQEGGSTAPRCIKCRRRGVLVRKWQLPDNTVLHEFLCLLCGSLTRVRTEFFHPETAQCPNPKS